MDTAELGVVTEDLLCELSSNAVLGGVIVALGRGVPLGFLLSLLFDGLKNLGAETLLGGASLG